VVPVAHTMAKRITESADVDPARVHVIDNWSDGEAIVPAASEASRLRSEWNLRGKFVVLYSGNFGRVHEFGTLLEAAARLQDDPDIRFVLIGRGPRLAETQRKASALGNVQFRSHVPRELLSDALALGDVHVVVLHPAFEGLVQPSKLYGVMAAGRPTLFIGSLQGETASILKESDAGIAVATGDADALVSAIRNLGNDASMRARLGANARRAFEQRYDMPIALAKWEKVLNFQG
jgi:colanic acid biosynthesis glycosyl transferase WcaI